MSKKSKKSIIMQLYCIDGFCQGQIYQIKYNGQKHFYINLINNPIYSIAIYKFTGKYTPLGEHILIFDKAIKRNLNEN